MIDVAWHYIYIKKKISFTYEATLHQPGSPTYILSDNIIILYPVGFFFLVAYFPMIVDFMVVTASQQRYPPGLCISQPAPHQRTASEGPFESARRYCGKRNPCHWAINHPQW